MNDFESFAAQVISDEHLEQYHERRLVEQQGRFNGIVPADDRKLCEKLPFLAYMYLQGEKQDEIIATARAVLRRIEVGDFSKGDHILYKNLFRHFHLFDVIGLKDEFRNALCAHLRFVSTESCPPWKNSGSQWLAINTDRLVQEFGSDEELLQLLKEVIITDYTIPSLRSVFSAGQLFELFQYEAAPSDELVSDTVQTARGIIRPHNVCFEADNKHRLTTLNIRALRDGVSEAVYYFIDGQVVAAVKTGESDEARAETVIGLRTVRDPNTDTCPIVEGGYYLPEETNRLAAYHARRRGQHRFDLSTSNPLALKPHRSIDGDRISYNFIRESRTAIEQILVSS